MKIIFRYPFFLIFLSNALYGQAVEVDLQSVGQERDTFIEEMVETHNFDRPQLTRILSNIDINERILEAISRPAERVLPWHEYRQIFLNDARINGGVEFWINHADMIQKASEFYGVAPEMLVSILGIETYYGQRTGNYRVVDSLATLAFAYPPRADFFRSELESFFLLVTEEDIDPDVVMGSYAGAMGAGQFISSSYRAYAVDGDSDGRRDLWNNWDDVLSSVANYFSAHGWQPGEQVAIRASVSQNRLMDVVANSMSLDESIGSLRDSGYVFSTELSEETPATVLSLQGENGQEYWVGYHNFHVITRYNHSVMYALAAYQLGEIIRTGYEQALN
ncbi:MAG: lytic murein transglycosylase B [Candidatus Rariloculaceae bacterium]